MLTCQAYTFGLQEGLRSNLKFLGTNEQWKICACQTPKGMGWAKLVLLLWQEMFDEYQRGLAVPGTPIRTFRLRVLLFAVVEVPYSVGDPFTPEEIQDGRDFFARSRWATLRAISNAGR